MLVYSNLHPRIREKKYQVQILSQGKDSKATFENEIQKQVMKKEQKISWKVRKDKQCQFNKWVRKKGRRSYWVKLRDEN